MVVDGLSRRPTISLMHVPNDWKSQLAIEYSKDKFTYEVLDGLVHDDAFEVINDVIYYKDRLFLVHKSNLKNKIL